MGRKVENDAYAITVTFERSLSDDLEAIGRDGTKKLNADDRNALAKQLVKELQTCYNDETLSPGGRFVVTGLHVDREEYAFSGLKKR